MRNEEQKKTKTNKENHFTVVEVVDDRRWMISGVGDARGSRWTLAEARE